MTAELKAKIKDRIERVTVHGWNKLDLSNCGLTQIPEAVFTQCAEVSIIIDLSNDRFSYPSSGTKSLRFLNGLKIYDATIGWDIWRKLGSERERELAKDNPLVNRLAAMIFFGLIFGFVGYLIAR